MLDRKFEKFRGGQSDRFGLSTKARVTINRRGMIYLSARMFEAMGRPEAVGLYYNREDDLIAIEPGFERSDEHFEVVKKQSGWAIHASTFCRHYRIKVPNTERFLRPIINEEKTLVVSLKETVTVGGLERKKKGVKPATLKIGAVQPNRHRAGDLQKHQTSVIIR
jgi:hypothetical protein